MEVKEGFKKTEVGVIPKDWDVISLGDYSIKIGSGITPTGGEKVYKNEGRPLIRSQNVGWGKLILDDVAFINDEIHNTFKSTEIKLDDVFLNITGASIGRSSIADERVVNGNVNQHVCIIRTDKNKLIPAFLNFYLLSNKGQKQVDSFQSGGNRQGLNFAQIKSFKLPLPPLKVEQTAIATALSDADALINRLEKLIAKKQAIKQGTMQLLLTGKKRLPGFSGEWEVKRLGEVFNFLSTANNSRSDLNTEAEIGYIHYGDIHTKWKNFLNCSIKLPSYIAKEKIYGIPFIEEGDLVMADASEDYEGIGACVEIKNLRSKKVVGGLHTLLLRGDKSKMADGFKGYLRELPGVKESIIRIATGISVYGISKTQLKNIEITIPKVQEQVAIAKILSEMDGEILFLKQKLAKYHKIKYGMMQNLLTGKIRLM